MSEMKDDDLRGRFSGLRQQDRRHEPQFREVLNRAELRNRDDAGSAPTLRWITVAASIVIAAGVVITKGRDRDDQRPVATGVPGVPAITSWQSPTAGLLQTPSRALLAPPPLLSSVFDGVTQTALQSITD